MSGQDRGAAQSWRRVAVDLGCLVVALAAGMIGFGPLFGTPDYLIAGLGGILLGAAIAVIGSWRHWALHWVALCCLGAYLLFGGALADRGSTLAGVVPTLQTLQDLVVGIVSSWKALLTAHSPVGVYSGMGIVPLLLGLVCSATAVSLGIRASRPAWALVSVATLFVAVILFGADVAAYPVLQGAVAAACCIGWIAWRSAAARSGDNAVVGSDTATARRARMRAMSGIAALAVAATIVAVGAGAAAVPSTPRHVLRDAVRPPLDVHDLPSPLASYRRLVSDDHTVLFTVHGLPNGARIRLATMDAYNGIVYSVAAEGGLGSGTFSPVGNAVGGGGSKAGGTPATIAVTIRSLDGSWLPDAGVLRSAQFAGAQATTLARSLAYNEATGTAILPTGLTPGLSYTLQTTIPPDHTDARLGTAQPGDVALPATTNVPDSVSQVAAKLVGGAKSAVQKARDLQQGLSHNGYYSDGLKGQATSASGHGEARIGALLSARQMVGDDEQYAVAMALMARKIGLPARVVMGFYPKSSNPSQTVDITGADLHAWTEIDFAGYGWVSFDPTPAKTRKPPTSAPQPDPQPHNQVVQPPPTPKAQPTLPPESSSQHSKQKHNAADSSLWAVLGVIASVAGIVLAILVILLGPPIAIGAAKLRRRRRRRDAATAVARMTGAWDELIDHAVDAGASVPPTGTRRETAALLAERLPAGSATASPVALAGMTDSGVFGPGEPAPHEVENVWNQVEELIGASTASIGRWARLRLRVSLRSLRRRRGGGRR